MPKAIIFDWDDTLAHTRNAVVDSMEYVLDKYKKEPWDIIKKKYRDTTKSLKDNFPNFFGKDAEKAYNDYLIYYEKNGYNKVTPLENAEEFLNIAQKLDIDLYIVSNKDKRLLLKEINYCFPKIIFKNVLANGDAGNSKPAPDPVYKALQGEVFSINRNNVWLVGDSKQDTECAYNANVLPILIGTGKFMDDCYIQDKLNSSEPLILIKNFIDLINFLNQEK